ncbi:MAG TPA: hypothetical protein DCS83_06470 [Prevotella sp.]|jgi:predicted GH43/DUF377 family glycosyl hydrolase|nr:hypothetical protein [Prevotella sp.]
MKRKNFLGLVQLLLLFSLEVFAKGNHLPSWAFGGFVRPARINPLIEPIASSTFLCPYKGTQVHWECADTFNPAAIVRNDSVYVLYRAEDDPYVGIGKRTSRIGLAVFGDGLHVDYRCSKPVMYPDGSEISKKYEWSGGCEDPRVVDTGNGSYIMTFTSWDNRIPRLSIAISKDLRTWKHCGPAFLNAYKGKFKDMPCKSGSIVTEIKNGRQIMAKVNGKYLMYWGEQFIAAATSSDGINWQPVCDPDMNIIHLVQPRNGFFDSGLTECGPPAVITSKGILLIYNGKNSDDIRKMDRNYPPNTYAAGQVLFNKDNPFRVKHRLDKAFFRPMASYEKTGQYKAGTVFVEGLVFKDNKWFMYYGCADSKVGVAVYDPSLIGIRGDPVVLHNQLYINNDIN